jgi:hypothetical protein
MSASAHDEFESQTRTHLRSQQKSDSTDEVAAAHERWPHRCDATETLRWFGMTFPFSDLYVDRFAELDIDAEALQHLSDAELRGELQVRGLTAAFKESCRVAGSVDNDPAIRSCRTSLLTIVLCTERVHQIGSAIHRRRILEEIQRLGTCESTALNAWSGGRSNDRETDGTLLAPRKSWTDEGHHV